MDIQFQYIVDLAAQYKTLTSNSKTLFVAINNLSQNMIEDVYKEYGDPERDFKPVNLLRAEIARRLLQGVVVNEALVSEIKEKIRTKDLKYFSHQNDLFLKQLEDY